MTFWKFLKFGCLGSIGLILLLAVIGMIGQAMMSPQEKAAQEAARQAAANKEAADEKAAAEKTLSDQKKGAADLLRKLTLIRRCLPGIDQLQEQPAPAGTDLGNVTYYPVDYAFLTQFAETGFVPLASEDPHLWYRGSLMDDVQKALTSNLPPEKRDEALARAGTDFEAKPYLAVFVPLQQEWPVMDADDKKFVSGYFKGWVILLDARKQQVVSQSRIEAQNSAKVTKTRPTVAGIPIGTGIGAAIASDFTDNFWAAANAAISKSAAAK